MKLIVWFFVVNLANCTCLINVCLGSKRNGISNQGCRLLELLNGKNIVKPNTHHINEHEERNVLVQSYINDDEPIENMTKLGDGVEYWPPVDG